ncbi:MAG: bifunctional diguanylate cyclase/phosphodiesterase, partial [Lachnospiraceae bacterium]|nr:bifunctional diguanylate cyclase/phosphodiesterase [Lachnospiraceae bacterium]
MKEWMSSFDLAALSLLLIIMIWFLTEKKVPLKSHSTYFCLVSMTFMVTVLELIISNMRTEYVAAESLGYTILLIWYSVSFNLIPSMFAYYISLVANFNRKVKRVFKTICRVCMVTVTLILSLNPFIKWAYYYDGDTYVQRPGVIIVQIINATMVIMAIVAIARFTSQISFLNAVIVILSIAVFIWAWFVQKLQDVQIFSFFFALACATFYHYLHNPGVILDTKTHLYNRNFMGEYIASKFSDAKRFGVIVVAMDDFKFINKTYGVDTGDELLVQIGRFLRTINKTNVTFRFGSDQFCVVVNKNVSKMSEVAEYIHERFLHPWYCDSAAGAMMSASICCIECPKDAESYGELVEVIDYSMAVAKKNKKGGISWATDVELDKIRNDKAVEKAVRLAMDREELMVYYQPIYSVNHSGYNSAEALVRLKDDELGWISPEVFIPIAEKNGMIVEMGEIILEKVCKFIRDNNLKDTSIEYVEVNISPIQLIQVDFADRVKAILEKYDVEPRQINIEITETATIASMSVVKDNINKLVEYGITFSLDDYGSGSSNIDYINRMPFKIIKLDKYIIWDAFKNDKAGITLEYTIGMLNALQLLIVAEGVETAEMRDKLKDIG